MEYNYDSEDAESMDGMPAFLKNMKTRSADDDSGLSLRLIDKDGRSRPEPFIRLGKPDFTKNYKNKFTTDKPLYPHSDFVELSEYAVETAEKIIAIPFATRFPKVYIPIAIEMAFDHGARKSVQKELVKHTDEISDPWNDVEIIRGILQEVIDHNLICDAWISVLRYLKESIALDYKLGPYKTYDDEDNILDESENKKLIARCESAISQLDR